jgi:hypothetical protein
MQLPVCNSTTVVLFAVQWHGESAASGIRKHDGDHAADDVPSYAKVERWQDRQAGKSKGGTLQQAMTLDPTYFPEELYSAKDKWWEGPAWPCISPCLCPVIQLSLVARYHQAGMLPGASCAFLDGTHQLVVTTDRTSAKAASRQAQLEFWAASTRAGVDADEDSESCNYGGCL